MSENTCIALVIITIVFAPLIAMPIILNLDKHNEPDRITKLEQRIEKLEKIVTYIEMKEQL